MCDIVSASLPAVVDELVTRLAKINGVGPRVIQSVVALTESGNSSRGVLVALVPHLTVGSPVTASRSRVTRLDGGGQENVGAELELGTSPATAAVASALSGDSNSSAHVAPASLPLEGQSVVFTGKIDHPRFGRSDNCRYVEALGGAVRSAVTSKTNILVVGAGNDSKSQKLQAALNAHEETVTVWSAEQWVSFVTQHGCITAAS